MSDLSFSDLASSAGQTTGNFLKDIGNAAADFTCGLYGNHPGWIVNQLDPTGLSGGFGSGLMDSLCKPRPGYVAPTPQSSQPDNPSNPQYYNCPGTWTFQSQNSTQPQLYNNAYNANGKDYPTMQGARRVIYAVSKTIYYDGGVNPDPNLGSIVLSNIVFTPADKNCNSPDTGQPTQPSTPTPQELTVNTKVNNVNTQVSFNYAHSSTGLVVNVGGVNVRFDHNGMTLNDNSSNDNSTNLSAQISNVLTQVNYLTLASSGSFAVTTNPGANSASAKKLPGIRIVTFTLTSLKPTGSSTFGSPDFDIYNAGYFRFSRGNYYFPNEPIRYARSVFLAPTGADGYAYNLFAGYTGYATEYQLSQS